MTTTEEFLRDYKGTACKCGHPTWAHQVHTETCGEGTCHDEVLRECNWNFDVQCSCDYYVERL